ncbi:MAG: Uma2 family endonuclease [Elainellaceae cyanobacterium]
MSTQATPNPSTPPVDRYPWEAPEPPTELIFDDGEPLESNRHRIAMNVLIDSMLTAFEGRTDYFAGGNMFVYYSREQAMNRDFRGPDFFVALGVDGSRERQGWVVWEEGGRYPDVIVELMSPSTANVDKGVKKELYAHTFRTRNYFVYDPFDPESLEGWQLDSAQTYQPLSPNEEGWLWCDTLQLWLGTWEGQIRREPPTESCHWLRFYDSDKNLVLIPHEIAQQRQQDIERERQRVQREQERAQREQERANRLAARLRELGENPDVL